MKNTDILTKLPKNSRQPRGEDHLSGTSRSGYFYVACSEAALTPSEIDCEAADDILTHNNLANLINSTDMNCISAMQYAVEVLQVENIVICGHYGCKGVTTAIEGCGLDFLGNWLSPVVRIADKYKSLLDNISDKSMRIDVLCKLNVIEQVLNTCRTSVVKEAWLRGQKLTVSGIIYDHKKDVFCHSLHPVNSNDSLGKAYDESLVALLNQDDLNPYIR